jgi:hypothetical protein
MSESELVQSAHTNTAISDADANDDGRYQHFEINRPRSAYARTTAIRWHEFDDAVEDMNALCMSDRMKRLAIAPVLLDELSCVRDEWRWPSSLDTVDLRDATRFPARDSLISR